MKKAMNRLFSYLESERNWYERTSDSPKTFTIQKEGLLEMDKKTNDNNRDITECNVLNVLHISKGTVVDVDISMESFKIGGSVHDENGNSYQVLSIALNEMLLVNPEITTLLLSGECNATRLFID